MRTARRLVAVSIAVFIASLAATGLMQVRQTALSEHVATVIGNAMPSVELLAEARGDLGRVQTCAARYLRYHECDPASVTRYSEALEASIRRYFVLPADRDEEKLQVSLRERLADVRAMVPQLVAAAEEPTSETVGAELVREFGDRVRALSDVIDELIRLNARVGNEQGLVMERAQLLTARGMGVIEVLTALLAITGVGLALRTFRRSIGLRDEIVRARETDFRFLVETVRDYAIFLLDADGNVTTWNSGAELMTGYSASEIVGRHVSSLYPTEQQTKCAEELAAAASEGNVRVEGWRVRKDGSPFCAELVRTLMADGNGSVKGFIDVTRDLTLHRRAEEEHRQAEAVRAADRAKDEFFAILGHELRNPLAAIVMAVELMKLRHESGPSRDLDIISRQATQLTRLVEDLLDVSRITRDSLRLDKQLVDLGLVVERAVEVVRPLLIERRHTLVANVPEGLRVDGDEARLVQVVTNLVTNAAKYTPAGGHIWIGARREDGDVVLEVKDDGIGISADLLSRVFDLFVQGARGSDRAGGGLGIGLSLVQKLVKLHGGTVTARSEGVGKGSTFGVRLPAVRAEVPALRVGAVPTPPQPHATTAAKRILLVDDNKDALDVLTGVLRAIGHDVLAVGDGPAALQASVGFNPDIAILDIGLPSMDGYELASRLRSLLGTRTPRLIALTGYGGDHDRRLSQAAGFELHLVKPIDTSRLVETIEHRNAVN